jgi:hypothetical protein
MPLRVKTEGIFAFHLIFATLNLFFAYNDKSCVQQMTFPFSLQTWLLVDGYMELAVSCELFLIFVFKMLLLWCIKEEQLSKTFIKFMAIFSVVTAVNYMLGIMFRFAWMIIGAIIFWGQLNIQEQCSQSWRGISTYMWIYLIL